MTNDRNKEKGGGGGAASKTAIGSDLGIEFSRADFDMINEIHSFESQIFKLLVHSLCPAIYGHEVVKAGLLLALFGGECLKVKLRGSVSLRLCLLGRSKCISAKSTVSVRCDAHVRGSKMTLGSMIKIWNVFLCYNL